MFDRIYPGGSCRLIALLAALGFAILFASAARAQAPIITAISAPRQVVTINQNFTLSVLSPTATSFQWKRNGRPLSGATTASYTITSAVPYRDNGWYQVVAANSSGSTTSAVVFVNVAVAVPHILGFGDNYYGSTTIPSGLGAVVTVAAGAHHGLALKADGTVVGWGKNDRGEAAVPAGLSGVVAIAAGYEHSLALKSDGTVVRWGTRISGFSQIPAGLSDVVALAALRDDHSLVLKSDGTVVGWGVGNSTNYTNDYGQATIPSGLNDVVNIASGYNSSLAVKSDGTVVGWGEGFAQAPAPAGLSGVIGVAVGDGYSLAFKADGTVVGWGYYYDQPTNRPPNLDGAVAVATGAAHSIALKPDGTILSWATGEYGPSRLPAAVRNVVAVSAGYFNLILRNAAGDLPPTIVTPPASRTVNLGEPFTLSVAVSAGTAPNNFQWRKDGTAITGATGASYTADPVFAGSATTFDVVVTNHLGSVTSAAAMVTVNPSPVVSSTSHGRYVMNPGQSLTLTLAASIGGTATVQWKRNGIPIVGATARTLALTHATRATAGYYQAVCDDGTGAFTSPPLFVIFAPTVTQLVGWGDNSYGQLNFPAAIPSFVEVATNRSTANVGLRVDGTVAAWGFDDSYYEAAYPGRVYPVPVGLGNVVAVGVGQKYYVALKGDGTVVQWGSPNSGRPPVGLSDVVAISVGSYHTLALRSDGTVVMWSDWPADSGGVPAGLTGVAAVSAGNGSSLALKRDGTVVGWGYNGYGQTSIPAGLSGVVAISAGGEFSLALKSDGTVVGWGWGGTGQAVVLEGVSGAIGIAAGYSQALVALTDGSVREWWGPNGNVVTTVPPGLNSVFSLASGWSYSVALRDATRDPVPTFSSPASAVFPLGLSTSFKLAASGAPPPALRYRVVNGTFPLWATLDSSTGVIAGVAAYAYGSPFTFTIEAGNGVTLPVTQAFTLHVRPRHSADVAPADGAINLAELTRVLELYDTRLGTVRTGRYAVAPWAPGTIDGFEPDPLTPGSATVPLSSFHTADLNRDGRLSLTELTRVIELFNTRAGTARTGAYHVATTPTATEDGFAPGP